MKRDVEKALNEYHALQDRKKGTFGGFYANDFTSLWDKHNIKAPSEDIYNLTADALNFGFMIGYKAGKRARG